LRQRMAHTEDPDRPAETREIRSGKVRHPRTVAGATGLGLQAIGL
jgi:hypothetical protein